MKRIFPRALRQGDAIALIAPASPVDRERIDLAIGRLDELGFRIKLYGDLYRAHGYLAGDDATRTEELMTAFTDPEVAAVFPARGGMGVTRILDLLDYHVIRRHPKIFAGFSDNTALHLALQSQTGLVTFHSPHPMDGLGAADGLSDLSARTFWHSMLEERYRDSTGRLLQKGYLVQLTSQERESLTTLFPGAARGRLVGGNLALIGALMGTPYEIDTTSNILLLEDVGEQPYQVDRLLSQLQLAGKLDVLEGVLLGQFTDCVPDEGKPSLTLDEIFRHHFGELDVPVLQNFPTGHNRDNVTLPLNVEVELDADAHTVEVLENPVQLSGKRK